MATNLDNDRLNIRIEIKNNVSEPMEVDDFNENKSEEEGEIRDTSLRGEESFSQVSKQDKRNARENFRSFIEVDQKKLQDRAKRFSLKPDEMNIITDEDLNELYVSLGLNSENIDQVRFEAIHLRSSDELTLKDVTSYFMKYAPSSIEIIDDESFNIVWENKLSAARALLLTSQVVKGMPVRVVSEHVIDSFILDDQDSSKETALVNENRQVELTDDTAEEYKKLINSDSIDISAINVPIPPGYWRLGKQNIHSYSVLLRFSMITDKKPQLIEKCNMHFKSAFPKERFNLQKGIFSRNKDIKSETVNKDPWGILAKTWNEDYQFREKERYVESDVIEDEILPQPAINPELRMRLTAKRRLGKKPEEEIVHSSSEKEPSEESDRENMKKTIKIPRMRMYADEEEEKIKRRKLLNTLKKQSEKIEKTVIENSDLRNILRITNRKSKMTDRINEDTDLSLNLKNRRNKLVFTVAQESSEYRTERDVRDRLEKRPIKERKPRSPIRFKRNSPEPTDHPRRETHIRHRRSSDRRQSRHISGGEMYSTREGNDKYHSHKPKSKVALVIKTQKVPTVASTIRSRTRKYDTSSSSDKDSSSESSDSEESSDESDSSSSEDSDSFRNRKVHVPNRKLNSSQLKVRVKNEHERE